MRRMIEFARAWLRDAARRGSPQAAIDRVQALVDRNPEPVPTVSPVAYEVKVEPTRPEPI